MIRLEFVLKSRLVDFIVLREDIETKGFEVRGEVEVVVREDLLYRFSCF